MTLLGRFWRLDNFWQRDNRGRALALICGAVFAAGCGSDSTEPVETAQNDSPPPAAPAGDAHGSPGSPAAAGHGSQSAPNPVAHGMPGQPAAASASDLPMPGAHGAPGAATASAHGAPGMPPSTGHGSPPAGSPAAAHGGAGMPPDTENPEEAAHGAPPTDPNGQKPAMTGEKPTTSEWLAGMANSVLGGDDTQPSQAGGTPRTGQPGQPAGAHGSPAGSSDFAAQPGTTGSVDAYGLPGDPAAGEMPNPGMEGPPGQGFQGQNLPGSAQAPKKEFDEGTAEYAVQQLVLKMQAGETEGMSELISKTTNDKILAPLRDGTADQTQIDAAQELVTGPEMRNKREAGSTMIFYVQTSAGKLLIISARRDDSNDYRVNSIKVEEPKPQRRR